jgi:hypothetical protein
VTGHHRGVDFECFRYQYTVQQGKHSHTYLYAVAICPMPWSMVPLTIEREHLGHKLYDALGGEDIDFESDEFSRTFWVRSKDRKSAYDVIHGPMMDFLLANRTAGTWQWRASTLMLVRQGSLGPTDVVPLVDLLAGFHGHLPRHRLHAAKHATAAGPKRKR